VWDLKPTAIWMFDSSTAVVTVIYFYLLQCRCKARDWRGAVTTMVTLAADFILMRFVFIRSSRLDEFNKTVKRKSRLSMVEEVTYWAELCAVRGTL
jgi:hypothetical protein